MLIPDGRDARSHGYARDAHRHAQSHGDAAASDAGQQTHGDSRLRTSTAADAGAGRQGAAADLLAGLPEPLPHASVNKFVWGSPTTDVASSNYWWMMGRG